MKKFLFLLTLLIVMAGSSWATTVQIGSGTTTTAYMPLYTCYGYNYSQQIYLASELSAGGAIASPITKVRFYYNSGGTTYSSWTSWTVYMGNTGTASFASTTSWIPVGSMTQVYSGNIPTPVAGTWLELPVTGFSWDGTSNIVVAVDENTSGYSCTAYWRSFTASGNRAILYYSDGTNPNPASPPTANYGPSAVLSQVQFDMTTVTPALSATPGTLGFGLVQPGNCSAEQTYTLSGVNLTAGPIVVTAPTGFEVSLTSGYGFGPTVNVAYTPPTLGATTIYVRFCPATAGAFTGNITNVGGGASINVAVTGYSSIFYMYCSSMAGYTGDEEIYSVTLMGNNNALACGVTAPGPGSIAYRYSNFMFNSSLANLPRGGTASFTVEENECDGATYYSNGCAIWVDWNQDGDFLDAGEQVYSEATTTASPRNIVGTFSVPAGALLGETAMRVTVAEGYSGTSLTPCLAYGYGETEDYRVNVVIAPSLAAVPGSLAFGSTPVGTPTAGLPFSLSGGNLTAKAPSSAIVITAPTGFEVSLNGSTWLPSVSVTYTPPDLPATTIYARFNPLLPLTNYSGNITCVGGGASTNVVVTGSTNYCAAGASVCDEYISNVVVGSISNPTACTTGGYANYTALSTTMNQLASYTITVTNGVPYSSDQCGLWIDWNQNLVFDAGEQITVTGGPTTYTATITVPGTSTLGNTRMRVRIMYTGTMSPCGTTSYGEVEDYTVNVAPAQIGTLMGYVYDQEGGCTTPLAGAKVTIGLQNTLTDGSGYYNIDSISIGTYDVTASLAGWVTQTVPGVIITLGGTTTQNICLYPDLIPPASLQAYTTGPTLTDVHVQWSAPGSLPPEQWIKWDNSVQVDAIGTGAAATFSVASRWPVADISAYAGMFLKKIQFWPYVDPALCTYTIKVWKGALPTPTQEYSFTIPSGSIVLNAMNEYVLPTGIQISGAEDFWFGYECVTTTGYPAGCCAGPAIVNKGDMILFGGVWQSMFTAYALDYNWYLHGWLAQSSLAPQTLIPMVEGTPNQNIVTVGSPMSALGNQGNGPSFLNHIPEGHSMSYAEMNQNNGQSPLAPTTTLLGYNVYRAPAFTPTDPIYTSNTYYDDLGLAKGTYCYEVSALYTFGESVKIGPVCVPVYTCLPPTNLRVPIATTTSTSAVVHWTPSAITPNPEWIYEYGPAGFNLGSGIGGPQYIDQNFVDLFGLTPGMEYDFYVRTFCTVGDSSTWIKKTFRTHWWDNCPVPSTAEAEPCGADANGGCNMTVPAFEPIVCGETKCGTGWFDGSNRDTDWYEFTLTDSTKVTWSGAAEFSYILGLIAAPCPASAFITYATGNPGDTIGVTINLGPGTYYAFAAPLFAEYIVCDSLDMYFAKLSCVDPIAPVIANVVYTPVSCTPVAHDVSADVTDNGSVSYVKIVWTVNGAAQTDIPMVLGTAPQYTATIPVQASGAVVSFYIEAGDNEVIPNVSTSATITYQDAYISAANLNAGPDQTVPLGNSTTLNATYISNSSCLKITEFTLYGSGTGYTVPYPAYMGTLDVDFNDIVEITNTGTSPASIGGIHLKCEGLRVTDYTFPAATVPAGGVVIVTFGTYPDDIPNLYFTTDQTMDVWSSGTSNGIWLTQADGTTVIDAVATNTWTFSVASGVAAADWSGTGVSSPSGYAGAGLHGADANSSTNWSDASIVAQNIGTVNSGLDLTCVTSSYTLTWSGGNLPAPVVANPITTPVFNTPGSYTFTATLSDGTCTVSDDVVVNVPVPVTPVADFTVNSTTQTTGGTVSTAIFTDLSTNYPSSWAWVITGPGAATFVDATTNASQNPHVQFGAPGLYTVELTATNLAGSDTEIKVDYILVTLAYCQSQASTIYDEEIYSVTVNGATNAYDCVTPAPGPGSILNRYSNFTTLGSLTSLDQNATIYFTVEENECDGPSYYFNGCAIWIDWNQDGIFQVPDEQVYTETTTTQSPRTITGSFTVPGTALAGETRMRVTVAEGFYGASLTPCLMYSYGETEDYVVTITVPAYKTLTVRAFLEGLYDGGGVMHEAVNDLFEPNFGYGIADQIEIELHNDADYSIVEYTSGLINLGTDGYATISTLPVALSGSYWITVKNRNHMLIVSAAPVSFAGGTINYDFTTAETQSYSAPLIAGPVYNWNGLGVWVMWGGEIIKDGLIDSSDNNEMDNDATYLIFGNYAVTDITGDGLIDSSDKNIGDNNATNLVVAQTP
jgi:PKD repeat protein